MTRRFLSVALAALMMLGLIFGALLVLLALLAPRQPAATVRGLEQHLGIALPDSTAGVQIELQSHSFGEYESYSRFEIGPRELDTLFADPAFQPRQKSRGPLAQVATASRGGERMDNLALRNRPAWWRPEKGTSFVLAQRSQPGPEHTFTGPDMSWYIVDTSNAAKFVVYVFVVEV